jgi:[acyl-carrier-protein] S-malonyltransferase
MDELTRTANAQLATFTLSLVVLDAVERIGLAPAVCAGHSLGEYSALVASGALSLADGAALVLERGAAMQEAADARLGTMAALMGIGDDDAEAACQRAEAEVWVANYNAPGQVVIAGTPEGIEAATGPARELGAKKVLPLPVSGAFHTPMMQPARARLRAVLDTVAVRPPEVPVVANVDARIHPEGPEWTGLLSAQLCSPVRWRHSLGTIVELGATVAVELGPGGVLTGMVRRAAPELRGVSVATPDDLDALLDVVAGADEWLSSSGYHGEHLYTSERLVVSPATGVFVAAAELADAVAHPMAGPAADDAPPASPPAAPGGGPGVAGDGPRVAVGAILGSVAGQEVRTPFGGVLVRWLGVPGERIAQGQPVAWVRSDEEAP